jgi:hypothetical protein
VTIMKVKGRCHHERHFRRKFSRPAARQGPI